MPSPSIVDKQAGKRFQIVRKYLKLKGNEMAELCGISASMVSMIESGQREIPQGALKALFLKKNISPTFVIVGVGPVEYMKIEGSGLITNVRDLQAEIEIMKSHIKLLQNHYQFKN